MKKVEHNDNNGKIGLLMNVTFNIVERFYLVLLYAWNFQKVDYVGAEGKSFFRFFKWGWELVLIITDVGF